MKVSQQLWNDLLMTPNIQSVNQIEYTENGVCVCVYIEEKIVFSIYYLGWLNEMIHFVVNGSYEKLFVENPNLRNFVLQNHDEIMNKLNHDQEFVKNPLINTQSFLSLFLKTN